MAGSSKGIPFSIMRRNMKRLQSEREQMEEGDVVTGSDIHDDMAEEYSIFMKNITAMPVVPMEDNNAFAAMDNVRTVLSSIHDWSDLQPGKMAVYRLLHQDFDEDLENIYKLAVETLIEFFTRMSARTVMKLLLLAYNLRNEEGLWLFFPVAEDLVDVGSEKELDEISGTVLCSAYEPVPVKLVGPGLLTEDEHRLRVITSISFLACSVIRVATRSASNYNAAKESIHQGIRYFYSYSSYLDSYPVTEQMMTAVKTCLTNNSIIRNTLYTFMHAGEAAKIEPGMKDFLYRIHTQYTGFHIYNLFTRGADIYHLSLRKFATYLNTTLFHETLVKLALLFENCAGKNDPAHELKMWRFARIFEPKFFIELQTRRCVHFVAILAHLNKMQDPEIGKRAGDVLQIAQIADMPKESKDFARFYALRAHHILTEIQLDGNYSNLMATAYRQS